MRILNYKNNNDFEYINNGIHQKVKHGKIWEFDEVMQDFYCYSNGLYLNEYEGGAR